MLTTEEIERIAGVYHAWRSPPAGGGEEKGGYEDEPGFCASVDLAEIKGHGFVLTPGRYVGFDDE